MSVDEPKSNHSLGQKSDQCNMLLETLPPLAQSRRAAICGVGSVGLLLTGSVEAAMNKTPSSIQRHGPKAIEEQFDRTAIADLIQRERVARDNGFWSEMASYYHPDSLIDISWFKGSGAEFVEGTKAHFRPDAITFHELSPTVVTVKNNRGIAETPCAVHSYSQLDGIDVSMTSYVRLLWRTQRMDDRWLISGLRAIYVRDNLLPCNPSRAPDINEAELLKNRPTYRYLAYTLGKVGYNIRNDLPGIDRPEIVAALRTDERKWLEAV